MFVKYSVRRTKVNVTLTPHFGEDINTMQTQQFVEQPEFTLIRLLQDKSVQVERARIVTTEVVEMALKEGR